MTRASSPVVLVFAATSGIGSALCSSRKANAGPLYVTGRDGARIEALARAWAANPIVADVTQYDQVESAVNAVVREEGRVDGVVQCAGSLMLKPAHTTSVDEWYDTLRANLDSAFFTVKAAARPMMKTGGAIVLIASAAARTGLPNHDAIAAAKGGVIGLGLSAAASYAARGIRVNCVAPGMIRTPLTEALLSHDSARLASESLHPLGRVGEPAEVASTISWLLEPEQSWITGQVFGVDGGLATLRGRVKV